MTKSASEQLPLTTGRDGQPHIAAKSVSQLLRSIALVAVQPVEPHTLADLAVMLMAEADHLDALAIAHTTEPTEDRT